MRVREPPPSPSEECRLPGITLARSHAAAPSKQGQHVEDAGKCGRICPALQHEHGFTLRRNGDGGVDRGFSMSFFPVK